LISNSKKKGEGKMANGVDYAAIAALAFSQALAKKENMSFTPEQVDVRQSGKKFSCKFMGVANQAAGDVYIKPWGAAVYVTYVSTPEKGATYPAHHYEHYKQS